MRDLLSEICTAKREEVARRKRERPYSELLAIARDAFPPRHFAAHLADAVAGGGFGLIAEIKRASPSRGLIREDFDPASLARAYAAGGAACLSVLTDGPYFQGKDADLSAARDAAALPVLRKDFIVDPYQVAEARTIGADCILLIMAALDGSQARELTAAAHQLGMDVLVEVHEAAEMEPALALETALVGINNRNLKTLEVDLATTEALAPLVPIDRLAVSESGLAGPADLARIAAVGVRCFLVGESLMRADDVAAATRALLAGAAQRSKAPPAA